MALLGSRRAFSTAIYLWLDPLVDALRSALTQVTVSEEPQPLQALPTPLEQSANTVQQAPVGHDHEQETNNFERVKTYLARHPEATDRDTADALMMSTSTTNKWRKRVKEAGLQSESQLSEENKLLFELIFLSFLPFTHHSRITKEVTSNFRGNRHSCTKISAVSRPISGF